MSLIFNQLSINCVWIWIGVSQIGDISHNLQFIPIHTQYYIIL